MEQHLGDFYGGGGDRAGSWSVYDPPAKVPETLQRMREAGLTHLMLHPAPVDMRQLELIASQTALEL